jgi:hypothetical protein
LARDPADCDVRYHFALAALVQIKPDLWIGFTALFNEIGESFPRDDVLDPKKLFRLMIRGEIGRIPAVQNGTGKTTLLPRCRRHHEKPAFLRRPIDRENRVVKILEAGQIVKVGILPETGITPTLGTRKRMQKNDSVGRRVHDRLASRLKLARVDSHVRKCRSEGACEQHE